MFLILFWYLVVKGLVKGCFYCAYNILYFK